MRNEIARGRALHGAERKHGVDEGRHERAQAELRAQVANEVAQHPGPELLRGELQDEDGDREQHARDSDHRCRNGDEDLPGGVGAAARDEPRERDVAVVRSAVEGIGDREQHRDRNHHDRRDDPERCPQGLTP